MWLIACGHELVTLHNLEFEFQLVDQFFFFYLFALGDKGSQIESTVEWLVDGCAVNEDTLFFYLPKKTSVEIYMHAR